MHLTRTKATTKLPIVRKSTKFVARAKSNHDNAVPLVIALRDMLGLARTAKEVREMIKAKSLKINGREPTDYRDSINLLNLLHADHTYMLTFTQNGRFALEKTTAKERVAKVINKKILKNKKIQLNFHDGTNILTDKKDIAVSDSVHIDVQNKITKHLTFDKGKKCMVMKGRYIGRHGAVAKVEEKEVTLKLDDKKEITLDKKEVVVL